MRGQGSELGQVEDGPAAPDCQDAGSEAAAPLAGSSGGGVAGVLQAEAALTSHQGVQWPLPWPSHQAQRTSGVTGPLTSVTSRLMHCPSLPGPLGWAVSVRQGCGLWPASGLGSGLLLLSGPALLPALHLVSAPAGPLCLATTWVLLAPLRVPTSAPAAPASSCAEPDSCDLALYKVPGALHSLLVLWRGWICPPGPRGTGCPRECLDRGRPPPSHAGRPAMLPSSATGHVVRGGHCSRFCDLWLRRKLKRSILSFQFGPSKNGSFCSPAP